MNPAPLNLYCLKNMFCTAISEQEFRNIAFEGATLKINPCFGT